MGKPSDAPRTLDANAAMWAMLHDIAQQVPWMVWFDGQGFLTKMSEEDWKNVFTAALLRQQRMAQQIDGGGYVLLGQPTRRFSQKRMAELLELIRNFGDSKEVRWSKPPQPATEKDLQESTARTSAGAAT